MKCSIIIPTYNKIELLKMCLKNLFKNTLYSDYEVIVVDNGSTDGTPDFLCNFSDNRLKYVLNDKNEGFARACNKGALLAEGELLLFLNNDTIPLRNWLNNLITAIDEKTGVAGSKLIYPTGKIQHAGIAWSPIFRLPYLIYNGLPLYHSVVNKRREMLAVTGACLLISRELFFAVGMFDESYINGFEDVDLCLKVRQMGYRVLYVPESMVIHLEEQTPGRKKYDEENLKLLRDKWEKKIEKRFYDVVIYEEDGIDWVVSGKNYKIFARKEKGERVLLINTKEKIPVYLQKILANYFGSRKKVKKIKMEDISGLPFYLNSTIQAVCSFPEYKAEIIIFLLSEEESYFDDFIEFLRNKDKIAFFSKSSVAIRINNFLCENEYFDENLKGYNALKMYARKYKDKVIDFLPEMELNELEKWYLKVRRQKEADISLLIPEDIRRACARIRVVEPMRLLEEKYGIKVKYVKEQDKISSDIALIQREPLKFLDYILSLNENSKIWFEIDDLLFSLPAGHKYKVREKYWAKGIEIIKSKCDVMTVATEKLKSHFNDIKEKVFVLPNFISWRIWKNKRKIKKKRRVVIGYQGTPTHALDFIGMEGLIHRIIQKYKGKVVFKFFGMIPESLRGCENVEEIDFTLDYEDFAALLKNLDFDFVIVPLCDNEFNRCKSNIKYLECSICKMPGVYSNLTPYSCIKHGETGFLASNLDEWFEYICTLIEDDDLREKMAQNAYEDVMENYLLEENINLWYEVFQRLKDV